MSDIQLPGASAQVTADTSRFRSNITAAQQVLLGLEPVVARQWWGLQNLSRAFGSFGSLVAGGFGLAVKEAISWESAMVGIQRTTNASGAELEELEAQLRKVAETTPIAVSELAELAEQAGALGIDNSDIPEFVRILGQLIASTNLTTADVDDLARVLNVMQVPVESFERFASTLLEVGRNTAATETEILALAKRFAPTAHAAGLLADEVLAISAAVISLGPRAEAGGTAVNKTFRDMATAISSGSDELDIFAAVSGKTVDQFITDFRNVPAQTFADFLSGLDTVSGGFERQISILSDLGITETRQVQALQALAGGTALQGDEQRNLNAILEATHRAWRDNTALVEVAKQRYGTTAAQLTLLQNQLAAVANTIGEVLLPPIKFFLGLLQDFLFGFQQLPGPIQFVLAAVVALLGGISLLAGGVLALIAPLVLMIQSWRSVGAILESVRGTSASTIPVLEAEASVVRQVGTTAALTAQQLAVLSGATVQLRDASGRFIGTQGALQAANIKTASSSAAIAPAAAAGAVGMSKFGKAGIAVAGVLALATVAMTVFGHQARESADDVKDVATADLGLVDALDAQRAGQKGAADEWLLQQITMAGVIDVANTLGGELWGLVDVLNVIKGVASFQQAKTMIDTIKSAADAGDEKARGLLNFMIKNAAVWRESQSAAGQLAVARGDLGIATDQATASEEALGAATDDTNEKQDRANQATIDYIDALLGEADAALAVKDAQQEYTKALREAEDPTRALAESEGKLAKARNDYARSIREFKQAEEDLGKARKKQAGELTDAEENLADARDRYTDSLDKISDAEEKLEKLRQGPALKDITDATNKLADAQLRLRHAEQSVEDAEWQLAFLRGENASDRAIEDAELALDDARQGVKDQTENVKDAEDDLDTIRRGTDPEEIADAERDLLRARRDSDDALRDIADREEQVKDLREDIANDTAYIEAQDNIVEAQDRVYDALHSVQEAEEDLARVRDGLLDDNVAKAQRDLERALIDQAKAAVELQKQQALLRGEYFDAGDEAQALADQLTLLLDSAPTPESRKKLEDWIALLRQAIPQPEPGGKGGGGGGPSAEEIIGPLPTSDEIADYLAGLGEQTDSGDNRSILERIMDGIFGGGLGSGIGGLAGGVLGTIFGPGGTIAGFIVGSLIGSVVGGLIEEFWPEISGFFSNMGGWLSDLIPKVFDPDRWRSGVNTVKGAILDALGSAKDWLTGPAWDIVQGLWDGFTDAVYNIFSAIGDWLYDHLVTPILERFGIHSPSTVFFNIGWDMITGLWNGFVDQFNNFTGILAGIPGRVIDFFAAAPGWLRTAGWDIISGLWGGFQDNWGNFWNNFLAQIPGWIGNVFTDAGSWLVGAGWNILQGLWNGFTNFLRDNPISNFFEDHVVGPISKLIPGSPVEKGPLRVLNNGYAGRQIVKMLYDGMGAEMSRLEDMAQRMAETVSLSDLAPEQVRAQFANDDTWRELAANHAEWSHPSATAPAGDNDNSQHRGGDTISITGADERSALDIAEEVMFKKLVRVG